MPVYEAKWPRGSDFYTLLIGTRSIGQPDSPLVNGVDFLSPPLSVLRPSSITLGPHARLAMPPECLDTSFQAPLTRLLYLHLQFLSKDAPASLSDALPVLPHTPYALGRRIPIGHAA